MRRLTGLFIFVSGMGLAGAAIAQQPQPQPTQTGGIQPLPPPPATTSASALPLPTIAPPPPPTVTATATATAPPTVTATVPPPPPPPTATATATTTEQLPPPPPPTATTTAPPPTTTTAPPITVVPAPKNSLRRDDGEMAFLYATSAAFGLVTGTWIDTLSLCSPDNKQKNTDGTTKIDPVTGKSINQCDPAGALVSPLLLGTLFPLGFFLWDNFYKGGIHRGVPSSISTGLIIGALEGLGVAGANFAVAGDDPNRWGSNGIMTSVFVGTALGGIGGYAFGEAVRPDPRKIALIASGAGWGALMGSTFGGGVANSDGNSVAQGMLVGNLVGINVGVLTTGVLAAVGYDPSWQSLKYMWLGAGIGLLGTSAIIYPIYLATGQQDQTMNCGDPNSPSGRHGCPLVNHGMVANSFGMLAGVVIAGILTRDLKDPEPVPVPDQTAPPPPGGPNGPPPPATMGPTAKHEKKGWTPPFMFNVSPLQNGGMVGISGQW